MHLSHSRILPEMSFQLEPRSCERRSALPPASVRTAAACLRARLDGRPNPSRSPVRAEPSAGGRSGRHLALMRVRARLAHGLDAGRTGGVNGCSTRSCASRTRGPTTRSCSRVTRGRPLHSFFGTGSTDASSTYRSMRAGSTTCSLLGGRAIVPALLDRQGNVSPPERGRLLPGVVGRRGTPANLRRSRREHASSGFAGYACGEGSGTSSVPMDCGSKW